MSNIDIRDFGAVGDGLTDNFYAFQKAQRAAAETNINEIKIGAGNYVVGNRLSVGTSLETLSGVTWNLGEAVLLNRAKTTSGTNQRWLFSVNDDQDVSFIDGRINGEDNTNVGIGLSGLVDNFFVDGTHFFDGRNFAINYADSRTDPSVASFNGLVFENIIISGSVGPEGDGAGINIFNRSQINNDPASSNVTIINALIDVTGRGAGGPQAIKFNNVENVTVTNSVLIGGVVASLTASNGTRNVLFEDIDIRNSALGIVITTLNNGNTSDTANIQIRSVSITNDDGIGQASLQISGAPENVTVDGFFGNRDVRILSTAQNTRLEISGLQSFERGDVVIGTTSGTLGTVSAYTDGVLILTSDGTFELGESIRLEAIPDGELSLISSVEDRNSFETADFRNLTLTGGNFLILDNGIAGGELSGLILNTFLITGEDGGGRVLIGRNERTVSESTFSDIILSAQDIPVYGLWNVGDNNTFLGLVAQGLNSDGASIALFRDSGTGTHIDTVYIDQTSNISRVVQNLNGNEPSLLNVINDNYNIPLFDGTSLSDEITGTSAAEQISGLAGDDVLFGGDGNDVLLGRQGDDDISGGRGNDRLLGGSGTDVLAGGPGDDTYVLTDIGDVYLENPDEGNDLILAFFDATLPDEIEDGYARGRRDIDLIGNDLDNLFRGNKGDNIFDGQGGFDTVDYSIETNFISVDLRLALVNGTSIGTDEHISIERIIGSDFSDSFIGDTRDNVFLLGSGDDFSHARAGDDHLDGGLGNDDLRGGTGDDIIIGGAGNDKLQGGPGADLMIGGAGDDLYWIYGDDDQIRERPYEGTDTALVYYSGYEAHDGIEIIRVVREDYSVSGNGLDNTIIGTKGDDQIDGRGGDDTLLGGLGSDTLIGGHGNDRFVISEKDGFDTILDFEAGLGLGDRIDLSGHNLSASDITIIDGISGAEIILPSGQRIILENVLSEALSSDDILYGDAPNIYLSTSGSERTGYIEVVASLDRPAATAFTAVLRAEDGTAIGGSDYAQSLPLLSFAEGQSTIRVRIEIIDDNVSEIDEHFSLHVEPVSGIDTSQAHAIAIIQDDDRWNDVQLNISEIELGFGERPVAFGPDGTLLLAVQNVDRTVQIGIRDIDGTVNLLPVPDGWENAFGVSMNALGEISGYAYQTSGYEKQPFIWRPDGTDMSGYQFLSLDDVEAPIVVDFNTSGTVIGYDTNGAFWNGDGVSTPLPGQPRAINEDGTIVGIASSRPFIWDTDDGFEFLDLPSNTNAAIATAINSDGSLVAGAATSDVWEAAVAFVWSEENGPQQLGAANEYGEAIGITHDDVVIVIYREFLGYDEYGVATFETDFGLSSSDRGLTRLSDFAGVPSITEIVDISADGRLLAFSQEERAWYEIDISLYG